DCSMKKRDEDLKKRKETEVEISKNNKQTKLDKKDSKSHEASNKEDHPQTNIRTAGNKQVEQIVEENKSRNLEEHWQTQKRRNFKGNSHNHKLQDNCKQVYRPIQTNNPGMTHDSLTGCNVELEIQAQQLPSHDAHTTAAANGMQNGSVPQNSGIDLMLPTPMAPPKANIVIDIDDSVVVGGMDGVKEKPTNMQEG
ncbi:hypothetical protein HAX54_010999, partial [Datura stramonium]|nr:hypothetical protein [Datura stramonium]